MTPQEASLYILLVEDDPGDAGLVRLALRQAVLSAEPIAPSIVWVESLATARQAIAEHKPDLVLLDLSLPDSAGVFTVEAIRGLLPTVPVVVLTGLDDIDVAMQTLEAGAQDYLVKGELDPQHLGRAVRHALTRARLEARLATSEARLNVALSGANLGVWEWYVRTGKAYFDARWRPALGYTDSESVAHISSWQSLAHPDDLPLTLAALDAHLHGETPDICCEIRMRHRDGHWVWMITSGKIVEWDEAGQPLRMAGIHQDISARKEAEQKLKEREAKLATLIDSLPDMLFVIDPTRRIVEYHTPDPDWLLFPSENFLGQPYASVLPPHVSDLFDHALAQVIRTGHSAHLEYQLVLSSGTRDFAASVNCLADSSGDTPSGFMVVVRDTTEERAVEQALRIAAVAFETQEALFVTDAVNHILRVNRAFTTTTGYTAEEVVGKTPAMLNSGRHDAAFYAQIKADLRRDGYWQGEIWNQRKNGEVYPEWLTVTAVRGANSEITHYVASFTDITERKAAEDEIKYLAFYDPLTRLPNRRLLLDRLEQALSTSTRSKHQGAVLFIDLDNFKTLNDTLGHDVGDVLLQQVARRLTFCVRQGDTVARLGGDEFVVMLEGLSEHTLDAAAQSDRVSEKILATLNQPYLLLGHDYHNTPSIGVTLFSGNEASADELLKRADLAMYEAKTSGRNAIRFFDPQMQASVVAQTLLEAELRDGIDHQQFVLYYQPQVDSHNEVMGYEALLRWQHPRRGLLLPSEFVPLAEDIGLIIPIGLWALEAACRQLARWAQHPHTAGWFVAVNISVRQLSHPSFIEQVLTVLRHTGAPTSRLTLEVTEGLLHANLDGAIAKMNALKAHGIGFSLDDFGTGFSSLVLLRRLPLDQLKIDKSFVHNMLTDANAAALACSVLSLGQSLGLAVIAEGVEAEAQRDFLLERGCRFFQGYLFGRPEPVREAF